MTEFTAPAFTKGPATGGAHGRVHGGSADGNDISNNFASMDKDDTSEKIATSVNASNSNIASASNKSPITVNTGLNSTSTSTSSSTSNLSQLQQPAIKSNFDLELNPFEQSFGLGKTGGIQTRNNNSNPEPYAATTDSKPTSPMANMTLTPGGRRLLPPLSSMTTPNSLITSSHHYHSSSNSLHPMANQSSGSSSVSLRSGPLSPAMLPGPHPPSVLSNTNLVNTNNNPGSNSSSTTTNNSFASLVSSLRSRDLSLSESGIRSGLTPGNSNDMFAPNGTASPSSALFAFPADTNSLEPASPSLASLLNVTSGPSHPSNSSSANINGINSINAKSLPHNHYQVLKPRGNSTQLILNDSANAAANGLFMLSQGQTTPEIGSTPTSASVPTLATTSTPGNVDSNSTSEGTHNEPTIKPKEIAKNNYNSLRAMNASFENGGGAGSVKRDKDSTGLTSIKSDTEINRNKRKSSPSANTVAIASVPMTESTSAVAAATTAAVAAINPMNPSAMGSKMTPGTDTTKSKAVKKPAATSKGTSNKKPRVVDKIKQMDDRMGDRYGGFDEDNFDNTNDDANSDANQMVVSEKDGTKRPMTEEEKRKNFLERNRLAALKCRQRKKQWLKSLQDKVEHFSNENEDLKNQVKFLTNQVDQLRNLLSQTQAHEQAQVQAQMQSQPLHNKTNNMIPMNSQIDDNVMLSNVTGPLVVVPQGPSLSSMNTMIPHTNVNNNGIGNNTSVSQLIQQPNPAVMNAGVPNRNNLQVNMTNGNVNEFVTVPGWHNM
ncbi:hypothetical protein NADFUDRAFT_45603 [Nadsonia fulvescens var. elongata DSM 6958]|uniref:BZIP domain-containing protein n=1 Tax=Nadsonia fulvescens var. elongata DSM 6958 TaxID=857566 RepID=A0A1E3PRQ7_9ASCO|nr:hypothetical protein NADFUDRAFT_45603 [Nadsonia fulvescens var. elongata DSM 6958]